MTAALMGGPAAHDNILVSWRWLGNANIELTYKGQIILYIAYFDRGPRNPHPLSAADVTHNEAICFDVKDHVATKISPSGDVWYYRMQK